MTSITAELLVIVALVLANGFFAGAEIAVVALRRTRIQELAEQGRRGTRAVLALRANPERFLATVQIGITVVGATAAAFGGETIAARLQSKFERVIWIQQYAEGAALAVVVAGISYLSIVVGELVPKSLALRSAERYALLVAQPLVALSWVARPVVWFLGTSANLLLKPFGDKTTFTETRHSAEELQALVAQATKAGTIHPEAGEIASRALEMPELRVADVMVPRQDVTMIPRHAPPEILRRILLEQTHSRMPVYEERIDNVVGYISIKDLLAIAWDRQLIVLEDVIRVPYFVPESKLAVELLKDMRDRHMPFAIVVDEQGGMSGIVTMEDLVEELVGEIFSEYAPDEPQLIMKEPDGAAVVSGRAPLREVERALGIELPDEGAWTTIAGLSLAISGTIPSAGEVLRLPNGITIEILDASPRRVRTVRVRPPATQARRAPASGP
jgi:putative hemolysin